MEFFSIHLFFGSVLALGATYVILLGLCAGYENWALLASLKSLKLAAPQQLPREAATLRTLSDDEFYRNYQAFSRAALSPRLWARHRNYLARCWKVLADERHWRGNTRRLFSELERQDIDPHTRRLLPVARAVLDAARSANEPFAPGIINHLHAQLGTLPGVAAQAEARALIGRSLAAVVSMAPRASTAAVLAHPQGDTLSMSELSQAWHCAEGASAALPSMPITEPTIRALGRPAVVVDILREDWEHSFNALPQNLRGRICP